MFWLEFKLRYSTMKENSPTKKPKKKQNLPISALLIRRLFPSPPTTTSNRKIPIVQVLQCSVVKIHGKNMFRQHHIKKVPSNCPPVRASITLVIRQYKITRQLCLYERRRCYRCNHIITQKCPPLDCYYPGKYFIAFDL